MAFVLAFRKSLLVTLVVMLIAVVAIGAAPAHGQVAAPNQIPANRPLPLEAKPPDEPDLSTQPDVPAGPDANPSAAARPMPAQPGDLNGGAGEPQGRGESGVPVAADTLAHPPEIATYVVPEYPAEARARKIQGRVLLMVIVDDSGKVEDNIQVLDSIPILDEAAMEAVRQWSFNPGRDMDGHPIRVRMVVPVPFILR
jgi:protein TonB